MQENLREILDNINKYKTAENVTIVCASKTRSAEIINTLPSLSLSVVGENKVQELLEIIFLIFLRIKNSRTFGKVRRRR